MNHMIEEANREVEAQLESNYEVLDNYRVPSGLAPPDYRKSIAPSVAYKSTSDLVWGAQGPLTSALSFTHSLT